MTWGSHCPQCGREDCGWVVGEICEGNLQMKLATLKQLRAENDWDHKRDEDQRAEIERLTMANQMLIRDEKTAAQNVAMLRADNERLRADNWHLRDMLAKVAAYPGVPELVKQYAQGRLCSDHARALAGKQEKVE